jgi:hypothetical protein
MPEILATASRSDEFVNWIAKPEYHAPPKPLICRGTFWPSIAGEPAEPCGQFSRFVNWRWSKGEK